MSWVFMLYGQIVVSFTLKLQQNALLYYLKLKLFKAYQHDTLQIVFSFLKLPDMFRHVHHAILRGCLQTNFIA
jgi:hypothetical protein